MDLKISSLSFVLALCILCLSVSLSESRSREVRQFEFGAGEKIPSPGQFNEHEIEIEDEEVEAENTEATSSTSTTKKYTGPTTVPPSTTTTQPWGLDLSKAILDSARIVLKAVFGGVRAVPSTQRKKDEGVESTTENLTVTPSTPTA